MEQSDPPTFVGIYSASREGLIDLIEDIRAESESVGLPPVFSSPSCRPFRTDKELVSYGGSYWILSKGSYWDRWIADRPEAWLAAAIDLVWFPPDYLGPHVSDGDERDLWDHEVVRCLVACALWDSVATVSALVTELVDRGPSECAIHALEEISYELFDSARDGSESARRARSEISDAVSILLRKWDTLSALEAQSLVSLMSSLDEPLASEYLGQCLQLGGADKKDVLEDAAFLLASLQSESCAPQHVVTDSADDVAAD